MSASKKYINKNDFQRSQTFQKINKDINTCLVLIQKLISFNQEIWRKVKESLDVEHYIIDYRVDQFGYFENTLRSIFYDCYSLKNFYEVSAYMNFKGVDNTLGDTLDNQRGYITFNAIVKLSSIFEFTRKEYEQTIKGKKYFDKMAEKYSDYARSLELLNNMRNTIHSNGKWGNEKPLEYDLREGSKSINKGEVFQYDHWKLYRVIKDSLELHKLLALDNKALTLRRTTKTTQNGDPIVVVQTNLTTEDWNKLSEISKE